MVEKEAKRPLISDPITIAVVQNKMDHIARQMGQVMLRTAHSPIFNQSHDFSCFITDGVGRLISQADGIPIHTGGGGLIVEAILRDYPEGIGQGGIEPGDVFISSDPYEAGGNHLPDWVISRPVFRDRQLVAFLCNRAHQSDIGGGMAGTYNPEATEIFHEGIRLPVLRLAEAGQLREDLWRLLLLNSRTPDLLDGDLHAMLGSTQVGARRIEAMLDELGLEASLAAMEGILDHAERRMRQALSALPDGHYRAEEMTDNDCFDETEIHYRVCLSKEGDSLRVDFTGTDPQMRGFKNSSFANTRSAVYVAVTSFLDPAIPRNDGTYRPIEVIAPLGSTLNPKPPAPMTMCTVLPSHEIIQAVWKALGQADPNRACAGWGKVSHCNMAGPDGEGGTYVMYHWGALPAGGAVQGRDGFNQIGPLNSLGNLVLPNGETYEQLYPIRLLKQEFRQDAAGAGQFRGGSGVDYEVLVEAPATYAFRGEGQRTPSGYGLDGGVAGAAGEAALSLSSGETVTPPQFGNRDLPALRLSLSSPAGGGLGDPRKRDREAVRRDLRDGVISLQAARRVYGWDE